MVRRGWLLAVVLSVTAGAADAVGLMGFGLFTAHLTGNLAVLAVHFASGRSVSAALLLSIPAFIGAVGLARLLADRLTAAGRPTLRPLLWAQFGLLVGFLVLGVARGPWFDPRPASSTVAVLLAVGAMAVQNALVQISLPGQPATTVMTVNLTRLSLDVGTLLVPPDRSAATRARQRAGRIWPVLAGFVAGAALGAASYALVGRWAAAPLAGLAALALVVTHGRR